MRLRKVKQLTQHHKVSKGLCLGLILGLSDSKSLALCAMLSPIGGSLWFSQVLIWRMLLYLLQCLRESWRSILEPLTPISPNYHPFFPIGDPLVTESLWYCRMRVVSQNACSWNLLQVFPTAVCCSLHNPLSFTILFSSCLCCLGTQQTITHTQSHLSHVTCSPSLQDIYPFRGN